MIAAKQAALRVLSPVARWINRRSARVLMYHRFARTSDDARRLSAAVFERQVQYVKRHFAPCRMDFLAHRLRDGKLLPRSAVVLTVDDGYADFAEIGYPILRRHNVPATVFVVSRFADQAMWLWFDALHYLTQAARGGDYQLQVDGRPFRVTLATERDRQSAWSTLADACADLDATRRDAALRAVQAAFDVVLPASPTDAYRAMTWNELRRLDEHLIEIGAHTCTHPVLSHSSIHEIDYEVTASKAAIERELGRPVRSFCYPSGRPGDYDERVLAAVERAGYGSAVVAHGSLVHRGSNLLALTRMGAPGDVESFRNLMDGYEYLSLRARARLRLGAEMA